MCQEYKDKLVHFPVTQHFMMLSIFASAFFLVQRPLAVTEVEKGVIHLGSYLAFEEPPLHGVGQKPLALGLRGLNSMGDLAGNQLGLGRPHLSGPQCPHLSSGMTASSILPCRGTLQIK